MIVGEGLTDAAQAKLNERIAKAKAYFEKELDEKVNDALIKLNKELQQQNKVRKLLKEMKSFINFFWNFTNRYRLQPKQDAEQFNQASYTPGDEEKIPDENSGNLFSLLKQIRKQLANEENVAPYMICHDATLKEMTTFLPQDISDLALIKGMGDYSLNKYGEAFLIPIQAFCRAHGLEGKIHLKEEETKQSKKKPKNKSEAGINSQTQSFQLFQSGKSIAEIALQRNFAEGTIQAHLSHFVKSGELDVFRLVSKEKFDLIKSALQKITEPGLAAAKHFLGEEVSYAEIRFVIAAMNQFKEESA